MPSWLEKVSRSSPAAKLLVTDAVALASCTLSTSVTARVLSITTLPAVYSATSAEPVTTGGSSMGNTLISRVPEAQALLRSHIDTDAVTVPLKFSAGKKTKHKPPVSVNDPDPEVKTSEVIVMGSPSGSAAVMQAVSGISSSVEYVSMETGLLFPSTREGGRLIFPVMVINLLKG